MISFGTMVVVPWGPTIIEITEKRNERKEDVLREELRATRRASDDLLRREKDTQSGNLAENPSNHGQ